MVSRHRLFNETWDSSRDRRQEKRCSARYLLLRYVRTPAKFDPNEIRRLVTLQKACCTIVCEQDVFSHSDTYLVFIDFSGKRFQTRNDKLFDVQGNHPQWHTVTRSPTQAYEWCKRRGVVLFDDSLQKRANFPSTSTGPNTPAPMFDDWNTLLSSGDQTRFFKHCEDIIPTTLHNSLKEVEAEISQPTPKSTRARPTRGHTDIWSDGFEAGFRMATEANGAKSNVLDLPANFQRRRVKQDPFIDDCLSHPMRKASKSTYPIAVLEAFDYTHCEQMEWEDGAHLDFAELEDLFWEPPAFT